MQIAGRGTKISPLRISSAVMMAQARAPSPYDAHWMKKSCIRKGFRRCRRSGSVAVERRPVPIAEVVSQREALVIPPGLAASQGRTAGVSIGMPRARHIR